MKRKLLMVVVLFVSLIVAGCQNSESQGKVEKESENAEQNEASKGKQLEGTIRVSTDNDKSQEAWNAVAEAYMEINPDVEVIIDNKPQDGYQEWLTAQFATSDTPEVDIVTANMVQNLIQDKKFVDYIPYFEQENPYTGKLWKESVNDIMKCPENDEIFCPHFDGNPVKKEREAVISFASLLYQ